MKSTAPAVRGLIVAHYATVHHAALKSGLSEADAQDLTQAVWEVVLRRLSDYDQGRPFPTWIMGITYHVARNFRKMERRARRIFDGRKDPADIQSVPLLGPATPEQELARNEEIAIAMEAIQRLPPELCTVFLMAEAEKLRQEEIAAQLGLPQTTVAARLRAAWEIIERAIHRRRIAGLLAAWLAAGLSSLIAARAEAQTLARRVHLAGKRLAVHGAIVCAIGMFPMAGAALPAASCALSPQAPERVMQASSRPAEQPKHDQGAPVGARQGIPSALQAPNRPAEQSPKHTQGSGFRGGILSAVQAPISPAEQVNPLAGPREAVRDKACGEQSTQPDRCESPAEVRSSKLADELLLLPRVRAARRAGNIALARTLLKAYDARYPQGVLRKERDQVAAELDP